MAEISLYKVTSGWTDDDKSYAGAEWYLRYETESISNGKTRVNWELYKRGRTSTPTWISTTIELYFTSDYTITADSGSSLSWTPDRITTDPNTSGSNHPHCSYNPKHNTTSTKSGSFVITHNNNGAGNFKVELKAAIYTTTLSSGGVKTTTLSNNKPYTACYWDSNAYVRIDKSIQKPGADITISWSGAQSGTENPIDGFEVYYSIDGGSWIAIDTSIAKDSSSITMEVPDNRGSTIAAQVIIKNRQAGFTTDPKTGGSCLINRRPSKPTNLTPNQTIIPSTANSVSFSMNAGSDTDGQSSYSIKYATSEDSTKRDYDIGTNLPFNTTEDELIYYFWTWDGLETSEDNSSCTIRKNTKPTVSIGVTGTYIYNITATKGEDGQSNDEYSYGYTYNKDRLIITTASTKRNVGDIRYLLSKQLTGLDQDKTYKFRYWVQRNDGIEDSDRVYSNWMYFTTPNLNLNTGNGPKGYFGTNIDIGMVDHYYPIGIVSIDNDKATVSFDKIQRGAQLDSIEFKNNENSSQSFNIKLASKLTRVYGFDFSNVIINSSNPFKPYSQPEMVITMASRDTTYGFLENKTPSITCGNSSITGIKNNNTWRYIFTPDVIWDEIINDSANDATAILTKELTITNDFDESFTYKASFSFDFREAPIIENFSVCENASFIKENTELTLSGKVKYYNKIVNINIKDDIANQTRYSLKGEQDTYLGNPWQKNDNGGWERVNYYTYDLTEASPVTQPAVNKFYKTNFTINATSADQSTSKSTEEMIPVLRHTPPRIRFTGLEYVDSNSQKILSGSYIIEDLGYDLGNDIPAAGYVQEIYILGPDKDENNNDKKYTIWIWDSEQPQKQPEQGVEIGFEINYPNFTENLRSLCPRCTNNLEGSEKTTEDFEYLIVYNILPTIAYRQNHLGINTKDPSANEGLIKPVLTVSAYNEENEEAEKAHRYVYLTSAKNTASIDLATGALIGFVVDCGSWDGTSG